MKRSTHPVSPALDPAADKAREVVSYQGLNSGIRVLDARDRIRVVLNGDVPRGVKGGLRIEGFKRVAADTWEAPHTPMSIYGAQAVVQIFYEEKP